MERQGRRETVDDLCGLFFSPSSCWFVLGIRTIQEWHWLADVHYTWWSWTHCQNVWHKCLLFSNTHIPMMSCCVFPNSSTLVNSYSCAAALASFRTSSDFIGTVTCLIQIVSSFKRTTTTSPPLPPPSSLDYVYVWVLDRYTIYKIMIIMRYDTNRNLDGS